MDRSTPIYAPSTLITVLFPVTVAVGLQPNPINYLGAPWCRPSRFGAWASGVDCHTTRERDNVLVPLSGQPLVTEPLSPASVGLIFLSAAERVRGLYGIPKDALRVQLADGELMNPAAKRTIDRDLL
jgi:hypothetical protein